jgi:hypothetical protein
MSESAQIPRDAIAQKLAALGKSDLAHLRALERNRAERCAILTDLVESGEAALSPSIVPAVIEPKDDKK